MQTESSPVHAHPYVAELRAALESPAGLRTVWAETRPALVTYIPHERAGGACDLHWSVPDCGGLCSVVVKQTLDTTVGYYAQLLGKGRIERLAEPVAWARGIVRKRAIDVARKAGIGEEQVHRPERTIQSLFASAPAVDRVLMEAAVWFARGATGRTSWEAVVGHATQRAREAGMVVDEREGRLRLEALVRGCEKQGGRRADFVRTELLAPLAQRSAWPLGYDAESLQLQVMAPGASGEPSDSDHLTTLLYQLHEALPGACRWPEADEEVQLDALRRVLGARGDLNGLRALANEIGAHIWAGIARSVGA